MNSSSNSPSMFGTDQTGANNSEKKSYQDWI